MTQPLIPTTSEVLIDPQVFAAPRSFRMTYDLTDEAAKNSMLTLSGTANTTSLSVVAMGNGLDVNGDGISDIIVTGALQ